MFLGIPSHSPGRLFASRSFRRHRFCVGLFCPRKQPLGQQAAALKDQLSWRLYSSSKICTSQSGNTHGDSLDSFTVKGQQKAPVNPSILNYIQYLDIGIPKKKVRARKQRRNPNRSNKNVLSKADEAEHFRSNQSRRPKALQLPPPPFVVPPSLAPVAQKSNKDTAVVRYPVKILGSAGSMNEELPKATKGLPEVVSESHLLWKIRISDVLPILIHPFPSIIP